MLRKTALVTGASGGIGSAIAREFAKKGYNLALTYYMGSTESLEKELSNFDIEIKSYHFDQKDADSIKQLMKSVFHDFDYVDAIICNAGISDEFELLSDKAIDNIDLVLNTNLRGTMLVNREALKYLIKQKHGTIVNISSILGRTGGSCETVYSASKAGIIGLTKALASEVAPYNIRVNTVAPGMIETKMTDNIQGKDREVVIDKTPLARVGLAEEVAPIVVFLASDNASFITGECYGVTGGAVKF